MIMKKYIYKAIAVAMMLCLLVLTGIGIKEAFSQATVKLENTGISATPAPTLTGTPTEALLPTEMPTQTPSPSPTSTPTPSASPTPTAVPIFDKISEAESAPLSKELPVTAALLVNISKEEVLYSYNATADIYPASITKLVTAYTALEENPALEGLVEISENATKVLIEDSKMCKFKAKDQLFLKELLAAMLLFSGNDAAISVGEHISGSEAKFVELMNKKATELGLRSSHFCNTHGLPDDDHKTSAADIYLIMEKLFHFEEFLGIIEMESVKVNILRDGEHLIKEYSSTNQFVSGSYKLPEGLKLIGGKTGTTNKAGCCLVMYVTDPAGNCYIAEIFGAESVEALYKSMIRLLECISVQ